MAREEVKRRAAALLEMGARGEFMVRDKTGVRTIATDHVVLTLFWTVSYGFVALCDNCGNVFLKNIVTIDGLIYAACAYCLLPTRATSPAKNNNNNNNNNNSNNSNNKL